MMWTPIELLFKCEKEHSVFDRDVRVRLVEVRP